MQETYTIGPRTFVLDRAKAQAALAAKRVVGGRETMTFNLLPLRYGWAYELYRTMKANHWEPEDVPMQSDIEQWRDRAALSEIDRWIVRMGIGYFRAAEGIVGDNVIHVVRELVTASELKLVLGRHAHEENIHADSLLYMISSLGIDPHECEAMFDDIPTIVAKNRFVTDVSRELRRDLDMTDPEAQAAARAQHLRLRAVHGGHAVLRPVRDDPVALPAGEAARDRDDVPLHAAGRVQPHRALPAAAARARRREPGDLDAGVPRGAARADGRGGRARAALHRGLPAGRGRRPERDGVLDATSTTSPTAASRASASRRCAAALENPLPWLAELMDVRSEQNFFEGRVTEYQQAVALAAVADEEL